MENNKENPDNFIKDLEGQMKGVKGGDYLTDSERRTIKSGVGKGDNEALAALARQYQEFALEQNPLGLPLIFREGNEIKVRRNGTRVIQNDWRVSRYDRGGNVVVERRSENVERVLSFKEFYELNPPDEKCKNAEYLEEYRKSFKRKTPPN